MVVVYLLEEKLNTLKPVSVMTNNGQRHPTATDHVGSVVLAHMARSSRIHLVAVICKGKGLNFEWYVCLRLIFFLHL